MIGPLEEIMMMARVIRLIRLIMYIISILCIEIVELLALSKHNIIHTGEKYCYCNVCDISLFYHIRSHTGEKPSKYNSCGLSIPKIISINNIEKLPIFNIFAVTKCSYYMIHAFILCTAIFKLLAISTLMISHIEEKPFYCNHCDSYLCIHMKNHTGEISYIFYPYCKAIFMVIFIYTSQNFFKSNMYAVSQVSFNTSQAAEIFMKYILCIAYFWNINWYKTEALVVFLTDVILFWLIFVRNMRKILVNYFLRFLNLHNVVFIKYDLKYYISIQINFIDKYFTSHTKTYFVVCFGSESTVCNEIVLKSKRISCPKYIVFQSNRMGLLFLVNLTPVRFPLTLDEYITRLLVEYIFLLLSIDIQFYYRLCRFSKSAIHYKTEIFCKIHKLNVTICYSGLSFSYPKNAFSPFYIRHRRRG